MQVQSLLPPEEPQDESDEITITQRTVDPSPRVLEGPDERGRQLVLPPYGVDQDGQTVGQGGTSTVTVTLKPGRYEFYCPVDGHKDAGMKGTLTVK